MHRSQYWFLVLALSLCAVPSATSAEWASPSEVRRFLLSVRLTDFPIKQKQLFEDVGLPKGAPPMGGSTDSRGRFNIYALTDPLCKSGYYAARIYYDVEKVGNLDDLPVLSVDVLFVSPIEASFVAELPAGLVHSLPELKSQMRTFRESPRAFAARFFAILPLNDEKKANQALEPTTTSVTPPAGQEARQP